MSTGDPPVSIDPVLPLWAYSTYVYLPHTGSGEQRHKLALQDTLLDPVSFYHTAQARFRLPTYLNLALNSQSSASWYFFFFWGLANQLSPVQTLELLGLRVPLLCIVRWTWTYTFCSFMINPTNSSGAGTVCKEEELQLLKPQSENHRTRYSAISQRLMHTACQRPCLKHALDQHASLLDWASFWLSEL